MSDCKYCEGERTVYMGNNAPENQPCPVCQLSEPAGDSPELLGVVSWNEKGFWQADVFNTEESDETPIWYCTGKTGGESNAVAEKAFEKFGDKLNVVLGYYGEREYCGDEKLMPETECECGGIVNGYA